MQGPQKKPRLFDQITDDEQPTSIEDSIAKNIDINRSVQENEGWTVERLFRTFRGAEEIERYIEENQDTGLLALLERFQQIRSFKAREKLGNVNSLEDVKKLLRTCDRILVLTGAGVSVSAGIPDFRSTDGIYARLKSQYEMPSPSCMFDRDYFSNNPGPFFDFAVELWPGKFEPTKSHKFIAELERRGKLLRNYTQNIDTLERKAGIKRVVACHGSFATASCTTCGKQVDGTILAEDILNKRIARCPECFAGAEPTSPCHSVMKPDIVFFGESLPDHFFSSLKEDLPQADLLLVIGTSLKVAPVSEILPQLPIGVPAILVNREVVGKPHRFDVELLGDSDEVLGRLWEMLDAADATCECGTESNVVCPRECSDADEAAAVVEEVGVVRWVGRPATFLFAGFALSPAGPEDWEASDVSSGHPETWHGRSLREELEGTKGDQLPAMPNNSLAEQGVSNLTDVASDRHELDGDALSGQARSPVEAEAAGYDPSWGVQRPRPSMTLLSSLRR